ncbi:PREDICTED: protein bric-a-brac 2-like [Dufourea novaeangliae]|uniref:Protein bric-a-brac 1 n=1 Tax=Dufourea novaeangliae TaxID=178035 RepID=A0A154P9W9_DUFNO|nr:PREDICTED: protein bric-a-brac 2-like [Dufourea novaeangliae]KZC08633.1 Protein bric-a-brac 1 [Dufourea novaeangliae]
MREDTVLSLKWHSFPSHLAVSLDTCYEKQQFVDLSLVCKDGTILKCHKMVLANSSSFFRRLLVANDHPHPMIILHDVEADELKTIINFMYCGEIQVVQSEVRRLLKLAEILEVTGLRHIQTSVLVGESNDTSHDEPRKTATVAKLKIEEPKALPTKPVPEHDPNARSQNKTTCPTARFLSSTHPHKGGVKLPQEITKKGEESAVNLLSQRLETGRSGISIVDVNDMPSTSRGIPNPLPQKRKDPSDNVISWPRILSAISKDQPLPLKKLCIMDEVEITLGKPPMVPQDTKKIEPLDKRKQETNFEENQTMNCAVYIKDEVDISPEIEEDEYMDPLEVEELENESPETIMGSSQRFSYTNIDQTFNSRSLPEFPPRKGSNG